MKLSERNFEIMSDGLRLDGRLHEGDGGLAAAVLHPHPQYGGDMDNHVVLAACQAFADLGATTLRFNFRGTGRSEGVHDQGRGEADDARAACAALRHTRPASPLVVVGYSFGAAIAANVAGDVEPSAVVLISPPAGMMKLDLDAERPTLVIAGDRDQIAPAAALRQIVSGGHTLTIVPGVDHGWWPGLDELSGALREFARVALRTEVGQS